MICELSKNEYHKIRSLIKGQEDINVTINSIIDKNNRGKIYVDNLDKPRVAIIWAIGCMYYIIGDTDNEDFNSSLDTFITNVLGPDSLAICGGTHFGITICQDENKWTRNLNAIFNYRNPYKEYRYYYVFDKNKYKNYENDLPEGYIIKRIDKDIINNDLENLIVNDILGDFWISVDNFLDKGIGFCVLKENKIISNCFSGYVSGEFHDIVIRTYGEENERKGFATSVSRAFIDCCILNNITPCWSTDEENISSQKIAEKCGFKLYKKCKSYYFPFLQEHK